MSRARHGVAVGVAVGLAYALVVRPWFLTWGASAEEARSAPPGDQSVPGPRTTCTRVIAIAADSEDVWPWLAQAATASSLGAESKASTRCAETFPSRPEEERAGALAEMPARHAKAGVQ